MDTTRDLGRELWQASLEWSLPRCFDAGGASGYVAESAGWGRGYGCKEPVAYRADAVAAHAGSRGSLGDRSGRRHCAAASLPAGLDNRVRGGRTPGCAAHPGTGSARHTSFRTSTVSPDAHTRLAPSGGVALEGTVATGARPHAASLAVRASRHTRLTATAVRETPAAVLVEQPGDEARTEHDQRRSGSPAVWLRRRRDRTDFNEGEPRAYQDRSGRGRDRIAAAPTQASAGHTKVLPPAKVSATPSTERAIGEQIAHLAAADTGWRGAFSEYRLASGSDVGEYYAESINAVGSPTPRSSSS